MSTIIDQNQRGIQELMQLTTYADMTDEEIERVLQYKINASVSAMETAYKNKETLSHIDKLEEMYADACDRNVKALQYMCERKTEPVRLEITKLEFHPMEFSNE